MKINILDYERKVTEVEIKDFENVKWMYIRVVSGDEVLVVKYKDSTELEFDSSDSRLINFYDGKYEIYNSDNTKNPIDDPEFLNRKTSYDYLY